MHLTSNQGEANRAPSLFNSLSSQPTPQHSPPATAYIVSVIGQNRKGDRIKVLWSHMPGEPWWMNKCEIERQEDGLRLLEEYRAQIDSSESV